MYLLKGPALLDTGLVVAAFEPPTVEDMHLSPFFEIGSFAFGKQTALILLSVVVISWFFLAAAKKRAMVPGKLQFVGEAGYGFVRNSLGQDIIGAHHFKPFVPVLFASFFYVLVNNLWGSIPFIQLPAFSHIGAAYALAGFAYIFWIAAGIRAKGVGGFFKAMTMPPGVPKAFYVILVPLEFLSNLIIRPMTHSLRLFATMFAGHLALMIASYMLGFLLTEGGLAGWLTAPFALVFGLFLYFLEVMIQVIQAYVFTLLFSVYIQGAVADAH